MRFLSIGECMVEMAPLENGKYIKGFAGDTFNTAWYARQVANQSIDVQYMTAVGWDEVSNDMVHFIESAGVKPVVKRRADRTVGLYMISLKDGERSFSYWRGTSAARTLADDLDKLPNVGKGDMAFFTGITLAVLPEEGRKKFLKTVQKARDAGVKIAFDTNLRPKLWSSESEMQEWTMKGAGVADIALPSFEDEADVFADSEKINTAHRYSEAGADLVCVKDGPNPVLILEDTKVTEVAPTLVSKVVDSTSAGDSFNAQFLMGLMQGDDPTTAADKACRLSAKVVAYKGALVPLA